MNYGRGLGEIALAGVTYVGLAAKGLRCPGKRPCDETSAGHAMQYVGVQSGDRCGKKLSRAIDADHAKRADVKGLSADSVLSSRVE